MAANRVKILWGANPHLVIHEISLRLGELGFGMEPQLDVESGIYTWYCPISNYFMVSFAVSPEDYQKSDVDFGVDLGIDSKHFAEMENQLAIWECDSWYNQPGRDKPVSKTLRFLTVPLHWLMRNAEPPVKKFSWSTAGSTVSFCADELMEDYVQYGLPFIEKVDTIEKLLKMLRNIDNYPKKTPGRALKSADGFCYAALILNELGRKDEALNELEIGLKTELASIERNWPAGTANYDEAIAMTKCRYSKYKKFVSP